MTDDPAAVATAAARQLAAQFGQPRLLLDVQAAIRSRGAFEQPRQFADPVALASLIVSIAGVAWQIYSDKKKEGEKPTREMLIRAVRVRQRESSELTGAEEKIIEVVVAEIVQVADDDE